MGWKRERKRKRGVNRGSKTKRWERGRPERKATDKTGGGISMEILIIIPNCSMILIQSKPLGRSVELHHPPMNRYDGRRSGVPEQNSFFFFPFFLLHDKDV